MSRIIGIAVSHRHKINQQVDIHVLRFYIYDLDDKNYAR